MQGQTVYGEGRLQSRQYTNRDGLGRIAVEIVANEMIMLGGRGEQDRPGEGATPPGPPRTVVAGGSRGTPAGGGTDEDDVPF